MMKLNITKKQWMLLVIGALIGGLLLVVVRFATAKAPEHVHYHANFALYINGERDRFDGPGYYEEVTSCSADNIDNPKVRTHMHNNDSHVVHVHDNAVTWGAFFANLGYTLGDTLIKTNDGAFVDGQGGKLSFMLNGEETDFIANKTVSSEDVLLISFGQNKPEQLKVLYDSIEKDAAVFNNSPDPAACSGNETLTFAERLKQAIGIGTTAGH